MATDCHCILIVLEQFYPSCLKQCLHLHYILVRLPFTLFIRSELIIVELELLPPSVIKDQDLVLISNISYLHMACYS